MNEGRGAPGNEATVNASVGEGIFCIQLTGQECSTVMLYEVWYQSETGLDHYNERAVYCGWTLMWPLGGCRPFPPTAGLQNICKRLGDPSF